jgi:hypothetical protein
MITFSKDYLYGFQTNNINNSILMQRCFNIEKYLIEKFSRDFAAMNSHNIKGFGGSKTTDIHDRYNIFMFPVPELYQLYETLRIKINPLLDYNRAYTLKAWLNVYRAGQNIKPHGHWPPEFEAWHGFYCVNVGENTSSTTYKIPKVKKEIVVPSVNGLIVIGRSDDDRHWSSVWKDKNQPRITIAFDIVPVDKFVPEELNGDFESSFYNKPIPFKTIDT